MSINIEEERVAFQIALASIYTKGREKTHPTWCEVVKRKVESGQLIGPTLFKVWLAAKEHAVEIAKQEVEFQESIYGWCVYAMRNGQRSFTASMEHSSKDDAVQWAKANGYRVIEE